MAENRKCFSCLPKTFESSSSAEIVVDVEPTFDTVKRIWGGKMEKSKLFLPLETNHILPIWIKFIRDIIKCFPDADAEEFYVETAELAARKFKHFSEDGWRCLNTEYPSDETTCSDLYIRRSSDTQSHKTPLAASSEVTTTPSAESISESLAQVEFLIQLVASSNFGLSLVKTALDPAFEPTYIGIKSPQVFVLPNKYLELGFEDLATNKVRKNLLNGDYDEYILPLQIANEINEKFWEQMEFHSF